MPKIPIAIIILSETLKVFTLRSGTGQGCPLLPLFLDIILEVLANAKWHEKRINGIQFEKEVIKLPLFLDYMIYVGNPKELTENFYP